MTIVNRTRTKRGPDVFGTRTVISTGVDTVRSVNTGASVCTDVVGDYGGNHGLAITHTTLRPGYCSGQITGSPVYRFSSYPMDNQSQALSHLVLPEVPPTTAVAITQVAAATNPSRPSVSLPVFIGELKDIPEMIHSKGSDLLRSQRRYDLEKPSFRSVKDQLKAKPVKGRNSVVEWNFGWAALGRDLTNMLDFAKHVNNRVVELNALYNNGGLKRSRTLMSRTVKLSSSGEFFQSVGATVVGDTSVVTTIRCWASIHWRPTEQHFVTQDDLIKRARVLVHGWEAHPGAVLSAVWALLPWSWFADYFFNISSYLQATENNVEFSPTNACRMIECSTDKRTRITAISPGITATPSSSVYVTKDRYTGVPSLSVLATQPVIAAQRLLTLSSIVMGR